MLGVLEISVISAISIGDNTAIILDRNMPWRQSVYVFETVGHTVREKTSLVGLDQHFQVKCKRN